MTQKLKCSVSHETWYTLFFIRIHFIIKFDMKMVRYSRMISDKKLRIFILKMKNTKTFL